MKLINKYKNKYLLLKLVIIIIILLSTSVLLVKINKTFFHKNENTNSSSYITLTDIDQIKLEKDVILINKIDLNTDQKAILDIDNNNKIDINDVKIFKDILSDNFKDVNSDGIIDNNDLILMKKALLNMDNIKVTKDYDLNYDGIINELDVDLMQKYISNVIDLDINQDGKQDYQDINILELYVNSSNQLNVLLPKSYENINVEFEVLDNSIITVDNNGIIHPLKQGITTIIVKDYKGNTDECNVVVVDSTIEEKEITLNTKEVYLKPASLTTVQKSAGDINEDGIINSLDLKILKDIIRLDFGDINDDGKTDSKDLELLNNYIKKPSNTNNQNCYKMDINQDGYINIKDYNLLEKYILGNKIGDVNKDNQIENRDIKLVSDYVNSYYKLNPKFTLKNATNKKVKYKSSNTNIATVTSDGIIYANKEGTATISATTRSGLTSTCKVIVSSNNRLPDDIKNDKKEVKLKLFDHKKYDILKADFNCDGIIDQKDKDIAKKLIRLQKEKNNLHQILDNIMNNNPYKSDYDINQDNKIDLLDYSILYKFINKMKTGDINNDNILDSKDIDLIDDYINSTSNIKVKVKDQKSISKVIYLSKNANIATVDEEGNIKSINKGITEITTVSVNGITDSSKIIVY